ncbi:MAG: zf-HC2 domain-containing protein [Candidatus Omnitrophica bacterium]|nr:zf-HC2 domain-containing protein [Candidatus Omnitrophota bacterium]
MNRICRKNQKLLSAYVDGMLPERARKFFDGHLDSCPECRKALQELELLRELLREFPEKHPGLGFETAILSRVREKPEVAALRSWSRRVSYGLAGLALLLIVTLYLQKPVLPPQLEVVRTPASGHPVVERKKTASVSEQKPLAPTEQKAVSRLDVLADKDAEKMLAPFSAEGKVKSETPAAPRTADSLARTEYAAVLEKEAGKHVVAFRKTAEISVDKESRVLVIRNKTEWEKTWNSQNTSQNLSLPLPEVDFKKQMVVALPTNQAGVEYKIVKTEEKPDRIIVQYRATLPGQGEAGIIPPYQFEVVNTRPSVELQKLD